MWYGPFGAGGRERFRSTWIMYMSSFRILHCVGKVEMNAYSEDKDNKILIEVGRNAFFVVACWGLGKVIPSPTRRLSRQ
jgi:hypothetical protein